MNVLGDQEGAKALSIWFLRDSKDSLPTAWVNTRNWLLQRGESKTNEKEKQDTTRANVLIR